MKTVIYLVHTKRYKITDCETSAHQMSISHISTLVNQMSNKRFILLLRGIYQTENVFNLSSIRDKKYMGQS